MSFFSNTQSSALQEKIFTPKFWLPVAILVLAVLVVFTLSKTKPTPQKSAQKPLVIDVKTVEVKLTDTRAIIYSRGLVQPKNKGTLVAEVTGKIMVTSPQFIAGGTFKKGDHLIRIDSRDYQAQVEISKAEVERTKAQYIEEQARSKQAITDWERLGYTKKPNALAKREPQVASAKANLSAAQAKLTRSILDLKRSTIKAPYNGVIVETTSNQGQFVNRGTTLAKIMATDYAEIRLPVSSSELRYLELPSNSNPKHKQHLTLYESEKTPNKKWKATINRVDPIVDQATQQTWLIARINNPYPLKRTKAPPLRIGKFVEARLQGKLLQQVFQLPENALGQDNQVMYVHDGAIKIKAIEILWRDKKHVWVKGLDDGMRVVIGQSRLPENTQVRDSSAEK